MSFVDVSFSQDVSTATKIIPEGKANGVLVSFGDERPVHSDKNGGQDYITIPAWFEISGQAYNELVRSELIKVKKEVWIAVDGSGQIDYGNKEDGTAKNADLARFFKSFGRDMKDSKLSDLIGGEVTLGLGPDKDQAGEPTGFVRVRFIGKKS